MLTDGGLTKMNDFADRMVFRAALVILLALVTQTAYQYGYNSKECRPIKTEVPLKNMTHKQQVRYIQRMNADKGVVK